MLKFHGVAEAGFIVGLVVSWRATHKVHRPRAAHSTYLIRPEALLTVEDDHPGAGVAGVVSATAVKDRLTVE